MSKIGAYITTHNNPLFLRFALLQVLAQTTRPNVVAIHQNNHHPSYLWAVGDLIGPAQRDGMQFLNLESPHLDRVQDWYLIPIRVLIDQGCDYFFKCDHDDIYYNFHIARLLQALQSGFDFVINRNAGRLVLAPGKPYEYLPSADFSETHAPGGMSGSWAFTRAFAIQNVHDLAAAPTDRCWEDQITAWETLPRFEGKISRIESDAPSTCYVSYGGNVSSAHWACLEWARANKHLFMND